MTARVWSNSRGRLIGASVLIFVALLFSSQLALAQFTQQGPKLVGGGAIGNAFQGPAVALSADGNTAIVGGPAAACAASTSRSHQAARTRSNSKWPIFICGGPSTLLEPHGLAKTKYRSAAPRDDARPPRLSLREAARHRTRNPRTSNHSAPTRSNLPFVLPKNRRCSLHTAP
jgi:hypothetical protein